MKMKNTFLFTVACMVLAYNYAWSGYILPSMVLSSVVMLLSYLNANPSSEKKVYLCMQTSSILLVEIIIFVLMGYDSSTWIHVILATSSIVSSGCWCMIYHASSRSAKCMFEKFVIQASVLVSVSFVLVFVLFAYNERLQFEILKFIVFMIFPYILTISVHHLTSKLRMTYSVSKQTKRVISIRHRF